MKKYMILLFVAALVVSLATAVFAFGPGHGMGGGMGFCNPGNVPPEQAQKHAEFQKQILPLKQKMLALKTDLSALYTQTTPDWNAIAQKQKEMVDVRVEIQKKAKEAGFGPGQCLQQNVRGKMGGGLCSSAQGSKMMRRGGSNL